MSLSVWRGAQPCRSFSVFPHCLFRPVALPTGGTGSNAHQQQLPDAARTLHHAAQSMFSLRTNKSMRLQKYGAWIAYHDTQSDQMFWYNPETSQVLDLCHGGRCQCCELV